jgi:adenylate cyclase class 2
MSFEVEQKFRAVDHEVVARRLADLGAAAGEPAEQEDVYLSHPCRDFAATNEAFRLRRVGDHNAITYKGPKRAGPTKTREEIEIAFPEGAESLARMRRLYEHLGFRPVAVVRKVRTPYHLTREGRAVEVALDQAVGLGAFVEVETIARGEADLPGAQRVIVELAGVLGLTQVEPRSYLRMLLEEAGGESGRNSAGPT